MWNMPMRKDASGLWTVTIGPLEPEVYRYAFFVDGGANCAGRRKPIPTGPHQRLGASRCMGNAGAVGIASPAASTPPAHSRYNPKDFADQ
jgi:hypothetical protein